MQKQRNADNSHLATRLTGLHVRHCTIYNLQHLDQICQRHNVIYNWKGSKQPLTLEERVNSC